MTSAVDWRVRNKAISDKPRREAQTKRQCAAAAVAAPAPWEPYAKKIEADAKQANVELEAAVAAVEKAIAAHYEYEKVECEGSDSKVDEKKLVGLTKHALDMQGVSVRRYWNGALVGPDCRRLLEKHDVILEDIRKGMVAARYGGTEARDFVDRHTAVLKELVVVSSITRRVKGAGAGGLLSDAERAELKRACAAFGEAWRASYHRILTPKGNIVDLHVPYFVDLFHACGVFGEDGAEALHVVHNHLCRRLVRQIRNPEDRHKAHTLHHTARDFTPKLQREVLTRQSAKQKAAKAAAVAAAAALLAVAPADAARAEALGEGL